MVMGHGAEYDRSRPMGGLTNLGQCVRRAAEKEFVTPACHAVVPYVVSRLTGHRR
jgi:hypothetical protein